MSRELAIACTDCFQYLWIAQEGFSGQTLYYGMPEVMKPLRDFLFAHEDHLLRFRDKERCDDDERYKEVDHLLPTEPSGGRGQAA